ncbi:hypothetical protein IW261DRAFT_1490824 [Armillaria novae-zelandiae]|uniref:Uncharacterized protein n=1 Tax=Armillaria novae-zelandiae TaxID=153914 RepID=A0AA39UF43_9AGAR|nr:hypothetical protein IW261DRAFT_1490824 [Armillaria novae-zelandiae]
MTATQPVYIPDSQGVAFDRRFEGSFLGFPGQRNPNMRPVKTQRQQLGLVQTIAFPSPTTTIITRRLPQTARLSVMISTLEINRALRRAFKDRYQKRETKANILSKGEIVQTANQIHIVTEKPSVAKNHPYEERKKSIAAPSPETSYRHNWNQEVMVMLRYSTSTFRMGL